MKNKFSSLKKKTGIAFLGGIAAILIVTGTAFAAGALDGTGLWTWTARVSEDDVFPDGGLPDGKGFCIRGDLADGGSLTVKNEDGALKFSTDGGQTWSEEAPEGFDVFEDGKAFGEFPGRGYFGFRGRGESDIMVKRDEDGTVLYSTDGGETWSEEAPEGFGIFGKGGIPDGEDFFFPPEGGKPFGFHGGPALSRGFGGGDGVMVKMEPDGTVLYSTDGGETWSEEAPEGMITEFPDFSDDIFNRFNPFDFGQEKAEGTSV